MMKGSLVLISAFVAGCAGAPAKSVAQSTHAVPPPDTSRASTAAPRRGMMGGMMGAMPMMGAARADTAAAPTASAAKSGNAARCPAVTQALVDEGRTVFSGPGNCFACHAANAKGTALAPDLTDHRWLDIDGSYASIVGLVRTGVAKPKSHPGPMPARGGGNLSTAQVCAVAAYVYSLNRR